MDNDLVFALILVALVFIVARTLYSRRSKRRLISDHQTQSQAAPGADGPSERDHAHAPTGRGTGVGG